MTARAKIENGQRSKARGVLPSAVAQVSVSNTELLESGDLEKGWKGQGGSDYWVVFDIAIANNGWDEGSE